MKGLNRYAVIIPVAAAALTIAGTAAAHGLFGPQDPTAAATRMDQMFTQEAQLLGTDVQTVKNAWADGKSMQQLAKDLGLTPEDLRSRMQDARKARMQAQLDAMVSAGVITQDQADRRAKVMDSAPRTGRPGMGMGMGMFSHGPPFGGRGHK